MRKLFLLFALISAGLFIYSATRLSRQFSTTSLPMIGEIKGFEDTNPTDTYSRLVQQFQEKVQAYQAQAAKDQKWYFWMSFLVTMLTAGSTLVSSIQAAKSSPGDAPAQTKTFAIVVAILTFASSLSNFGSTHFNEQKTDETKKATELAAKLNQFYSDYDKAAAADKPTVITSYARQVPN